MAGCIRPEIFMPEPVKMIETAKLQDILPLSMDVIPRSYAVVFLLVLVLYFLYRVCQILKPADHGDY